MPKRPRRWTWRSWRPLCGVS